MIHYRLTFLIGVFALCSPVISRAGAFHTVAQANFNGSPAASCSYLVQIQSGSRARHEHFQFLEAQHLEEGVQNEWQIGQTFQGYHMNLCMTSLTQQSIVPLSAQLETLNRSPHIVAVEDDQQVQQAGWLSSSDQGGDVEREENVVEKETDQEEEVVSPHLYSDYYNITGQQANTIACQTDAPWSLHRVGYQKVTLPLPTGDTSQTFPYVYEPTNRPNVYIMDTEVFVANKQYGGRAEQVKSYVNLNESNLPFPPHGSHVAGIVGAARYGICKWCRLLSVVTLGRSGTGSWSNVLNGATWIAKDAAERKSPVPAVVNLSLSGSKSEIINAAVNAMVDAGLIVVVAVGNSKIDACQQSPASATKPIKVGSSDNGDKFATFSNWGKCLDIIAPGALIRSSGPYNKELTMSGTSMSAPNVAGIIASALANGDLSPAKARDNYQLKYYLNTKGIQGAIKNLPEGTANLLVQVSYDAPSQCSKFQETEKEAMTGARRLVFQYQ